MARGIKKVCEYKCPCHKTMTFHTKHAAKRHVEAQKKKGM